MLKDALTIIKTIGLKNVFLGVQYPYRKAWAEARWKGSNAPRHGLALWRAFRHQLSHSQPAWPYLWKTPPDPVQSVTYTDRGVLIETVHSRIEITFFAPDLVRIRHLPHEGNAALPPIPYAIARPLEAWSPVAFVPVFLPKTLLLRTEAVTVGIHLSNATLFFADADGHVLRADMDVAWSQSGAIRHRTALAPDEPLFGLGERATAWNRRGRSHLLWNTDPGGYPKDQDPLDLNIPVYIGLPATAPAGEQPEEEPSAAAGYLVFYENSFCAEFDLGERVPDVAAHYFQGGELRYYFAAGPVPHLLERYTELTGRHALPPLWLLGYQQSRWSYVPEARVRQLVQDFHDHDVPCDAIHLDIDYMDGYRDFTWDKTRFPDLARLAADLREMGIKLVTIIDAGVKRDPDYTVYREGTEEGHFCALPDGEVFHAPVWPGLCAFPDFTRAETRAWWGEQYAPLIKAGIAGIWNDMNEPSAFTRPGSDPTLPGTVHHHMEGRGGDHREAHNLYGMQLVRATQEGLQRLRPEARPVVITRAGWAGVQRHATSWTGDNQSTWESLRLTIPLVMGLGLSGLGFTGPDTGGFDGAADGELFTRWIEMSTFMPFFRSHTMLQSPDQEPWSYGEPYLSINRRFIQLRYELLPYLYTAVWQMTTRGWPMVRPLWWNDPSNRALLEIDDAFLCGDALLIAPVTEPGTTRRPVVLPGGAWYDFWTNRIRQGGESFEEFAPLETLPLFVREGTVLPLGETGPSVEQRLQKFLRLHVYPLTHDGETRSVLYEDAGEGFGYQSGDQRVDTFHMHRENNRLTIRWKRQGAYQPPYHHIALTLNGIPRIPQAVIADGEHYSVVAADKVLHTALIGLPPFESLEIEL